jgi:hypothetical protein
MLLNSNRDTIQLGVARGSEVHELDEGFTSGTVGQLFSSLKQAKYLSEKAEKEMKLSLRVSMYERPAVWIPFKFTTVECTQTFSRKLILQMMKLLSRK